MLNSAVNVMSLSDLHLSFSNDFKDFLISTLVVPSLRDTKLGYSADVIGFSNLNLGFQMIS